MADEKAKIVTDATGPSSGPAPAQPEVDAQVSKQEQSAPEAPTPDKAEAPAQEEKAPQDKAADAPKEKAASVSVFNFSEIMAEKKATERAAAQQEAKAPDKGGFSRSVQGGWGQAGGTVPVPETPGPSAQSRQGKNGFSRTERGSQQEG